MGLSFKRDGRFGKFPDTGSYRFPDAKAGKDVSLAGPFEQLGCTFSWHGRPDQASFSLLMPTKALVSLHLHQVRESPPHLHTIREEYYPLLVVYVIWAILDRERNTVSFLKLKSRGYMKKSVHQRSSCFESALQRHVIRYIRVLSKVSGSRVEM